MVGLLLVLYLVWDTREYAREPLAALRRDRVRGAPRRIRGAVNAVGLGGMVLAVAFLHAPWREAAILGLAGASLWLTPREVRRANGFTWSPIVEVAVIFFGIFLTMIPALELLRLRGGELGVRAPLQFFWASGLLSSVLDNAPTCLAFPALCHGLILPPSSVGGRGAVL